MSKSRGNVIDPLVMIERYGTDAFRFTLTAFAVQGRDIKLSEERIEGYRHFVNKIWNASRLVLMNLDDFDPATPVPSQPDQLFHRWILGRLHDVVCDVRSAMDEYRFNDYAQTLYQFFWHEYCDWYLEMIKPELYGNDRERRARAQAIASFVLKEILVMLHPVMPFVTEEIWHKLPNTAGSIMEATFPVGNPRWKDEQTEQDMKFLQELVTAIRNIRGEMNVAPGVEVEVVCRYQSDSEKAVAESYSYLVKELARVKSLQILPMATSEKPKFAASAVAGSCEVSVILKDLLDFDAELKRIEKELGKLESEVTLIQKKLHNEDFLRKAPEGVVEKEREKLQRLMDKLQKLRSHREHVLNIRGEG
jgi:valyl-tRNA synthetase